MARKTWAEAVEGAIRRYCRRIGTPVFDAPTFAAAEIASILDTTGSTALEPQRLITRELHRLCDVGMLSDEGSGSFRLRDPDAAAPPMKGAKGVLVLDVAAALQDDPTQLYRFHRLHLPIMETLVGSAFTYQLGRGRYYAAAKVGGIAPDPEDKDEFLAMIEPGSFIEFGEHVPLQVDGKLFERGLQYPNGRRKSALKQQPVRLLSDDEFFDILDFVEPGISAIPTDLDSSAFRLREEHEPYRAPIDREKLLTSRAARDRQFRKRTLRIYNQTCAASGLMLLDKDGNAEVQAAHLRSVAHSGPDCVTNGIALCATVHWAYDRGMISFDDDGRILLSATINDPDFVRRFIPDDRRANFAQAPLCRPDPKHLRWHRDHCFCP